MDTSRNFDQSTRNYDQSPRTPNADKYGISEQNSYSKPDVPRLKFAGYEKSMGSSPRMGNQTVRLESPGGPLKTDNSDNSCFYKPDLSHMGNAKFMKTTGRLRGSNGYLNMTETNINGFRLKKCKTTQNTIPFNKSAGRSMSLGKKKGEKTIDPSYNPKFNSVFNRINNLCVPFEKSTNRSNPMSNFLPLFPSSRPQCSEQSQTEFF